MWGIFKQILKDKKVSLIAFTLGSLATIEMYMALFPTLRDQAEELTKLIESYPKGFMEAFGFDTGSAQAMFTKVENYMSTEYFSFFWPILTITMVIGFANAMIVGEIEKGTIELVLSQPVSRVKLFLTRYFAGVTYFTFFNLISVFGIIFFSKLHNVEYQLENYFTTFGITLLFGLAVFSFASFLSAVFSEKGKVIAVSAGVLLVMYLLNIVSSLKDNLENLQYLSFFYYMNPAKILGANEIVDYSLLVFGGTIIFFLTAGIFIFHKRDISV